MACTGEAPWVNKMLTISQLTCPASDLDAMHLIARHTLESLRF